MEHREIIPSFCGGRGREGGDIDGEVGGGGGRGEKNASREGTLGVVSNCFNTPSGAVYHVAPRSMNVVLKLY
jgi:hypothetical protein